MAQVSEIAYYHSAPIWRPQHCQTPPPRGEAPPNDAGSCAAGLFSPSGLPLTKDSDCQQPQSVLELDRREEIADAARDLPRVARRAFRKSPRSCSLGIADSAWSLATGSPLGIILNAAGLTLGSKPKAVEACSYIYEVKRSFDV